MTTITITRYEAIEKLVDSLTEHFSQTHEWIRETLYEGRVGFKDMENEELQTELNLWFDDNFDII